MKYSIFPSIFIYKQRIANEGGLNMTVAYPVHYFSKKIKALLYMWGFLLETYGIRNCEFMNQSGRF